MKTKLMRTLFVSVVVVCGALMPRMAVCGPQPPGEPGMQGAPMHPPPEVTQLRYSEEEIQDVLDFIETNDPTVYQELMNVKEKMPGEFNIIIGEAVEHKRELDRLQRESPEEYEDVMQIMDYERRERDLSRQYREATDAAGKSGIEAELKGVIKELFDLKLKQRQRELQRLEQELKNIKDEIEKRRTNKDKIIQTRFDEVTGKNDSLRW